jgi:voltage-gated potassium channel
MTRPQPAAVNRRPGKKLSDLVAKNLIVSVIVTLVAMWLIVSLVVYCFEAGAPGSNITSFTDSLWWGVVTFLTVGYGDRYPVTAGGRVGASFLMLSGVLSTAILTSKISSYFLENALREGRGHVNTARLKDHFIVCGWKDDIHELLTHILDFNPGLTSSGIVLVANVTTAMIENLHESPRLEKVHVVVGDYFQGATLQRAAPERARKVLILADKTPQAGGGVASATEVDARTIMTAMTLSSIARGTLVAAEILDSKMDQYLKIANVNEIIYSREYNRLLLGNASGGTGISNILFDLLDPKTPTLITTRAVEDRQVGLGYAEFKAEFERENPKSVVIGLLENTGNSHRIKELALRQAQKTPDMGKLVENLRAVKALRCNHPVFTPDSAYVLREGSMVIVIETRLAFAGAEGDADVLGSRIAA